ncbi:DUF3187 family protein [Sphingomicrobium sediminis]|uniref:DUF3187 family protein n=1 Tax=Sphingomicrobium sediminis TaxID=2950949 RepID=A0A9X2EK30_9SPHN|nr:DUF3187 family protein [Sphingomicrobium sediminis]MCM8556799.1 DUF3187 family protein [Sphingomicrobium sediminis]
MFRIIALGTALSFAIAAPAAAQSVTVSSGVDYSSGSYGTDTDTSILVVPFSLRTRGDGWSVGVSVPYINIDGSSSVVGGGGGPIITDPDAETSSRSGVGDLSVRLNVDIAELEGMEVSFGGRLKLPTGNREKRLSTGETDISAGLEVSATRGDILPYAELGYRVLGDPEGTTLDDGIYGSAGLTFLLGDGLVGLASYDYTAASVSTSEDSHSLFGALVIPAGDRLSVTSYGTLGLSEGAPDYGLGLLLSFKLAE